MVLGAARTFESPTVSALLPGVVTAADLPRALALSASAMQTAIIVGPALGGALYIVGPSLAYAVVAAMFLLASLLVAGIAVERVPPPREPPTLTSLLSGFVYIRNHSIVLGAISLDLFAVLLGGATALLPVYARDILHVSPVGLGLLRAAPAVGALATSMLLSYRPLTSRAGLKMFGAVMLFGVATTIFGLSTSFPLSLAALTVLGASDVVSVVVRGSLVQLETPDAMRGRVSCGEFHVHRHVEPVGRVRIRSHGLALRHRPGRGAGRRRHDRRGPRVVAALPGAAAGRRPRESASIGVSPLVRGSTRRQAIGVHLSDGSRRADRPSSGRRRPRADHAMGFRAGRHDRTGTNTLNELCRGDGDRRRKGSWRSTSILARSRAKGRHDDRPAYSRPSGIRHDVKNDGDAPMSFVEIEY